MSLAHVEPEQDHRHVGELQLSLGERIRKARKHAGLEQAELAAKVGVSRQLVSKWERDLSVPDLVEGALLSEICDVSFGWLGGVPVRSRCFAPLALLDDPLGQMELSFEPRPALVPV